MSLLFWLKKTPTEVAFIDANGAGRRSPDDCKKVDAIFVGSKLFLPASGPETKQYMKEACGSTPARQRRNDSLP